MSTFSNTAREVEMPNGDIVKLHDAVTPNSTSNIKKFKYDDNGHVTESEAANATDLNLNSYATPTSGTTAIGTSDNVQTAIGKLDHQSQIDKTNILYAINTGVKNIAFLKNGTYKTESGANETVFVVENGVVKVTSVTVDTRALIMNYVTLDAGTYVITNRQEDGCDVRLRYNGVDYNNTFTINTVTTFEVRAYSYKVLTNATITPLLCVKSVYDQDSSYQPPALPNSDLTQLEAEDRAALAEEIDAGAKNLLQNTGTTTTISGVTFTVNSDGSVSTYGTSTAANITFEINPNFTFKSGTTYVLSGCPNGGSPDGYRLCTMGITYMDDYGNGVGSVNVGDNSSRLVAIYIKNSGTNMGTTQSPKKFYPMICTKAAFGVSKAFVPYRPSYDDALFVLGERAPKSTDDTKSGGSMNDFDSGCVLCTSNVTGGAKASYCFVRTRIYDSNCVLQQAFYPADNTAYQRFKWSGTWGEWKQFVS